MYAIMFNVLHCRRLKEDQMNQKVMKADYHGCVLTGLYEILCLLSINVLMAIVVVPDMWMVVIHGDSVSVTHLTHQWRVDRV